MKNVLPLVAIQFPLLCLWTGWRISTEGRYNGSCVEGLIYSVERNVLVVTANKNKSKQVSWPGAGAMLPLPFALPQSVLAMAVHRRLWHRIVLSTIRSKSMTSLSSSFSSLETAPRKHLGTSQAFKKNKEENNWQVS
ncbi:hypothetical protein BGW80DRAFT_47566 [Lactifluus volemus]|nr:hypothetical protein BGW80DRAFT_47566 [Lactifluus volemus]